MINEYLSGGLGSEFGGIKVFMGSSTGNMLVSDEEALRKFFIIKDKPILIHSEDEAVIKANLMAAEAEFGDDIPFSEHPIRSRKACIRSTAKALEMAIEYGTRLHVLHVSTAKEVEMIRAAKLHNPRITAKPQRIIFGSATRTTTGLKAGSSAIPRSRAPLTVRLSARVWPKG